MEPRLIAAYAIIALTLLTAIGLIVRWRYMGREATQARASRREHAIYLKRLAEQDQGEG